MSDTWHVYLFETASGWLWLPQRSRWHLHGPYKTPEAAKAAAGKMLKVGTPDIPMHYYVNGIEEK